MADGCGYDSLPVEPKCSVLTGLNDETSQQATSTNRARVAEPFRLLEKSQSSSLRRKQSYTYAQWLFRSPSCGPSGTFACSFLAYNGSTCSNASAARKSQLKTLL